MSSTSEVPTTTGRAPVAASQIRVRVTVWALWSEVRQQDPGSGTPILEWAQVPLLAAQLGPARVLLPLNPILSILHPSSHPPSPQCHLHAPELWNTETICTRYSTPLGTGTVVTVTLYLTEHSRCCHRHGGGKVGRQVSSHRRRWGRRQSPPPEGPSPQVVVGRRRTRTKRWMGRRAAWEERAPSHQAPKHQPRSPTTAPSSALPPAARPAPSNLAIWAKSLARKSRLVRRPPANVNVRMSTGR